MKRLLFICLTMMISVMAMAQEADFLKAVSRYRTANSASAVCTRIVHKKALAKNQTSTGTLTMHKPAQVVISVNGGKDALIMNGSNFTMKLNGRSFKTSSTTNAQFTTFQKVFEAILTGGKNGVNVDKLPGTSVKKLGNQVVINIVPMAQGAAKMKHQLFTSFSMTIDERTSALKTLRMNQKQGNYVEYVFTDFKF